jgi:hypothetical protein
MNSKYNYTRKQKVSLLYNARIAFKERLAPQTLTTKHTPKLLFNSNDKMEF